MRKYDYRINGSPVSVHRVEHTNDLDTFHEFIETNRRSLAVDTGAGAGAPHEWLSGSRLRAREPDWTRTALATGHGDGHNALSFPR